MTKKLRLVCVITSIALLVSVLAGTGAYVIVNHINSKALSGDAALSIGNMLKDNNTINFNTYQALMTKLGNNTTSVRNSASINGGSPLVFQMGTVGDTPIYWQVVYQTADYITVWMTNSYTAEYFNYSGNSIKNSTLLGYTTGPYSNTGNYSQSVIHDLTKKIYSKVSTTFPVFADVIVAPSTVKTVDDWQTSQGNGKCGSYYAITNGLGSNVSTGSSAGASNPNNFQWSYSSCMDDMFWIPSFYEVFNTSTSSATYTNGYWGLSSSTYIVDSSSTALDGSSTSQYCWLRSGYSNANNIAMRVNSSGSADYISVNSSRGVRPAAHLSLSSLASSAGCEISASLASGAPDRALIALSDTFVEKGSETEISASFTPNTSNDFISAISINNVNINISASVASAGTFLDLSGVCKYKCYYSDNIVYIILKNLSVNVSITATVIDTPIQISLVGSSGSVTKEIVFEAATGNATVTIIDSSYYATGISLNGGASYQTIDRWNDTVYQQSDAFYVTYATTPYTRMIEFKVYKINGQVTLTIQFGSVQNVLKQGAGTEISGVALQTRLSGTIDTLACVGKATISGYTTTDGLDEVIVCATASAGFEFSHWEVDGSALDTATYGISAYIPYDLLDGKILVAVFVVNSADINTDTETDDTGGVL